MTKGNKTYQLPLMALLFCVFQMAGIHAYGQEQVKVKQELETVKTDSVVPVRQAPKARARRHREPLTEQQQPADTVQTPKQLSDLEPLDSLKATKLIADETADSLENINKKNLENLQARTTPVIKTDSLPPVLPKKIFIPNPTKATWLAVVFPGGGQIYNRKFWKLPIIYGGFAGCAYALSWNGKMYKDYSQAYLDIMDDDPNTNSFMDLLNNPNGSVTDMDRLKETIRKRKDMFRRYRDLSIFAFVGVYLISIIDAYVDAELSNFDITPDLSMKVEPAIINNNNPFQHGSKSVGVQCSFRF